MPDRAALARAGSDLVARVSDVMDNVDWTGFAELTNRLPAVPRIFVTGAGRSGLVARAFGMRLMHAGLTAFVPGETITPAAEEGDLVLAITCTGRTGFAGYVASRAKEVGATVVVLTAEPDSPVAQLADHVIHLPVRAEMIVTRAAVFEHAASFCLDAVFALLSQRLDVDENIFYRRHANLE